MEKLTSNTFIDFEDLNSFNSDSGWGCTIRSAQMLLSNALMRHYGYDDLEKYSKEIQQNVKYLFFPNSLMS